MSKKVTADASTSQALSMYDNFYFQFMLHWWNYEVLLVQWSHPISIMHAFFLKLMFSFYDFHSLIFFSFSLTYFPFILHFYFSLSAQYFFCAFFLSHLFFFVHIFICAIVSFLED